ncbi:MAG TPA: glycosyltransferase family A protein [Acidimicrobiales bacterium]|nr:glycosyltransferase family A protein [Acidimicrobiales bacterium]
MAELTAADLAVVIPTRDRWDILDLTLAALARQSVGGFETVVVVDGNDQDVPPLDATSVIVKRRAGPAAARNVGARSTERSIVMFLGDDTIPAPDLVERHLASHRRHPERESAAVGFVAWHDSVADNKINAWLDWSGTQFWYGSLAPEGEQEVSHWYFYTSNVSMKRALLMEGGGFDEDFPFAAFEDIECALRLSGLGLRLYYEPSAVCRHLHAYDWPGLERRFASMALSERLMVEMHPEVAPGCLNRMKKEAGARPPLPVERFVDAVPTRLRVLERLVRHEANRHYHRLLAPIYMAAWDRAAELCDLRRYLGSRYDSGRLVYGSQPLVEHATMGAGGPGADGRDEEGLFDLARQALAAESDRVHALVQRHLPPGSKVLDYCCGIGSEGLRLTASGFSVHFADHPGPPLDYLKWRLAERGLPPQVYRLGMDEVPRDFDAAFCLDASRPGRDPVEILHQLEETAPLVVIGVPCGPDGSGGPDLSAGGGTLAIGTSASPLVARHVLPDGSLLLVYGRKQAKSSELR